jgi:triosephosphate isomerase
MIAIINFKTYPQGTGKEAVRLAKICASVAAQFSDVSVVLAVQPADLYAVTSAVTIPVIAQHIDAITHGSHTGHILLESVVANGARGSLINHSERRLSAKEIMVAVKRLKENHLLSVLCVKNTAEAKKYASLKPDFIAVEPSKLIGGTVSVCEANPGLISRSVKAVNSPILVGAGIHDTEDVHVAIKLGAHGILVASDVLKAKNPRKELRELLKGFGHAKYLKH